MAWLSSTSIGKCFQSIEKLIEVTVELFAELINKENKKEIDFNGKHLNLPIQFLKGSEVKWDVENKLKRFNLELDKTNEENIVSKNNPQTKKD